LTPQGAAVVAVPSSDRHHDGAAGKAAAVAAVVVAVVLDLWMVVRGSGEVADGVVVHGDSGIVNPMHESRDLHTFMGSLHAPDFHLESFHEVLDGLFVLLLDVVDFYRIIDILLLLHEIC
nr:hypothetical protein [Tanacetum cinerariifolium]